jgi:hypothetical protein
MNDLPEEPQVTVTMLLELIKILRSSDEKTSMKTNTLLNGEENYHAWRMTIDQMFESTERSFTMGHAFLE